MRKTKHKADKTDSLVGQRLYLLRKSKEMTQAEFGKIIGVSFQQIQKYEKGINKLSVSQLYAISREFNTPLETFLPADIINGKSTMMDPDPETLRLIQCFSKIRDKNSRQSILNLVKHFCKDG